MITVKIEITLMTILFKISHEMFYFHAVLHKVQEVFHPDLFTKISFVLKLIYFSWRLITFINALDQ